MIGEEGNRPATTMGASPRCGGGGVEPGEAARRLSDPSHEVEVGVGLGDGSGPEMPKCPIKVGAVAAPAMSGRANSSSIVRVIE